MPRGRMLNKKISFDEKVANLSLKAALFYTWCIPNLDVKGRIYADPVYLRGVVVPYRKEYTTKIVGFCISEMIRSDLVCVYGNDRKYMEFKGFAKNQTLTESREATSEIPPPTQTELMQDSNGTHQEVKLSKVKISKDNTIQEVFEYFLLKTGRKFLLTENHRHLISGRLKEGYAAADIKKAIDNFMQDEWPDREKYMDLIYCIGKQKGKPDNLEKWINWKPKDKWEKR